ncbi:MAG: substrate-binding domain-containing protein [Nitrospirae bacterium]|nr:substrate-binding domain-containing protein [Nitrospirota bacterium]
MASPKCLLKLIGLAPLALLVLFAGLVLVTNFANFTDLAWAGGKEIVCASTTSTENSGLFAYLLPIFEGKTGITVKVVARGTGAAIELGKRGDADVVFVHARDAEMKAVEEGYFVNRRDVMYNDFVIVGPPGDPAKIKTAGSAIEAFERIASGGHTFVSRSDNSGTNIKELDIWKKAGLDAKGRKWYLEAGQGMEKTQRVADEKRAYTLSDRSTWLATKDKDRLDLAILFEGDPILFNQYGVMAVNPGKNPNARYTEAMQFINWLVAKEGQEAIGAFKDAHGNRLFIPNARLDAR